MALSGNPSGAGTEKNGWTSRTENIPGLRIAVNDDLTALEQGLSGAFELVSPGAAVAVVSYHSLEDRIVKQYFREMQKEGRGTITTKRPLIPSERGN